MHPISIIVGMFAFACIGYGVAVLKQNGDKRIDDNKARIDYENQHTIPTFTDHRHSYGTI